MDSTINSTVDQLQLNNTNKVFDILANRIHADEGFNCRGYIAPSTCIDLAKSIRENGLQQPITIQPYGPEKRLETGRDYRIIQGHRRFTAMTLVNHSETIPCMITEGLSELEALKMNFIENIQREPLNIVQEARALEKMQLAGMTQLAMARELRQERPWVQVRLYILDFPEPIQRLIEEGVIVQAHINEIHALPSNKWFEAAQYIQNERIRAGGKRIKIRTDKFKPANPANLTRAKPRKSDEINVLLDWIMDHGEPGIHTRALAWTTGQITTVDFLREVIEYDKTRDAEQQFHIPTGGIPGL